MQPQKSVEQSPEEAPEQSAEQFDEETNEQSTYTAGQSNRIRGMFNKIARVYDAANVILGVGQADRLRRTAIRAAKMPTRGRLLDLCTGTAVLALAARKLHPELEIVGIDFAEDMLEIARRKCSGARIHLAQADALALPLHDGSVDAITIGWGVRNIVDVNAGLREMARVLKSGGQLVILEFSRPRSNATRLPFAAGLRIVAFAAGLLGGDTTPYGSYLPKSIARFPDASELAGMLGEHGFQVEPIRRHFFGNICIHTARRTAPSADYAD